MTNTTTPKELAVLTLIERLERRHRLTEDDCWEWTGSVNYKGYGLINIDGKPWRVHRLAWELLRGPVPDGKHLHHRCYNRACFNPEHLEPRSVRENVLDADSQSITAENARKTHCKRGHPLSGENLYLPPTGGRACRECMRAKKQRQYRNRRQRRRQEGGRT